MGREKEDSDPPMKKPAKEVCSALHLNLVVAGVLMGMGATIMLGAHHAGHFVRAAYNMGFDKASVACKKEVQSHVEGRTICQNMLGDCKSELDWCREFK